MRSGKKTLSQAERHEFLNQPKIRAEWDFRDLLGLNTSILKAATIYEYTRQCDWIVEAVSGWLDKVFPEPTEEDHLTGSPLAAIPDYLVGHKVRDAVYVAQKHFGRKFNREVLDAVFANCLQAARDDYEGGHPILHAFCFLREWPKPFVSLLKGGSWAKCEEWHELFQRPVRHTISKNSGIFAQHPDLWREYDHEFSRCDDINVIPPGSNQSSAIDEHNGRKTVTFSIDMTQNKGDLQRAFQLWLDFVGHRAEPVTRSDYYTDRLKWLAGLRLHGLYKKQGIRIEDLLLDMDTLTFDIETEKPKWLEILPACSVQSSLRRSNSKAKKYLSKTIRQRQVTQREGTKGFLQFPEPVEWLQ
jgi:hypothetical protein